MAVEREIKTVLTLEDASFRKGLKAATSSVSAARAEMQASVASASGLTKGLKKFAAQTTGLNKVLKAEKSQMNVLKKEYDQQKKKLADATKELEKAKKEHAENSKEVQKAANAYAVASANADDLRVKMANLNSQIARDKDGLHALVTGPLKTFAKVSVAAVAAAGAALVKLTLQSDEAEKSLKRSLAETETKFGVWSHFIIQEADNAWKNVGLSKDKYLDMANEIGDYLIENGAPLEDAAKAAAELMEDMAWISEEYGVPIAEVWNDVKDAADGNRTALQRYGIQLTGFSTNTASANYQLTDEQKKLAAVKQILENSDKAQEDYTGKTNDIASATSKLNAAWGDFLSGAGSAENVGTAAGELVATWAANIIENTPEMIRSAVTMAKTFLKSFQLSFSATWKNQIWPEIQKYFKATFGVDLPDWEQVKQDLVNSWNKVKSGFANLFGAVFGVDPPTSWKQVKEALVGWWDRVSGNFEKIFHAIFGVDNPDWKTVWDTLSESWNNFLITSGNILQATVDLVFPPEGRLRKSLEEFWNNVLDSMPDWAIDAMKLVGLLGKDFKRPSELAAEQAALSQTVDMVSSAAPTSTRAADSLNQAADRFAHTIDTAKSFLGVKPEPLSPLWKAQKVYDAAVAEKEEKVAEVVKANTSFLGQVPIIGDLIKGLAFDAYKSASDKEKAAKDNLISAVNDAQAEANNNRQSFEEFQDALEKFAADVDAAADALADAGKYVKNVVTYAGGGSPVYSLRDISGGSGNIHNLNHLLGFAGGAWNIPMDNYLARLHAGEMVLTADQARRYRAMAASGGNTYNDSAAIYIDKYNQYSGADADGLLQMMQAMQRRQRMGYGLG